MAKRPQLVCQHLENISRKVLEDYKDIIREYVRRRHGVYALYNKQRGQICSWLFMRFPRCERGYREGERAREGAKRKAQGASKKKQLPNRPGQFLLKISLWQSLPD